MCLMKKSNSLIRNQILYGPILRSSPRRKRPFRKESFWFVRCNQCGKARWLRQNDLKKDKICKSCAAIERELQKLKSNPDVLSSEAEFRLQDWMDKQGIEYERQVPVYEGRTIVDFVVHSNYGKVFVEVHGYWHDQTKQESDQFLRDNYSVLFIPAKDI